nr:hypothetical protein CFP56_61176 [Quercus suber]
MPHLDEFGWLIQERKVIDFRGLAVSHLGNFPTLKLFQTLNQAKKCNLLMFCKEDIQGILTYMTVWKPEWVASKDLLRRLGWSMIATARIGTEPGNPGRAGGGGLIRDHDGKWVKGFMRNIRYLLEQFQHVKNKDNNNMEEDDLKFEIHHEGRIHCLLVVKRHLQGYNKYKKCWGWIAASTSAVFVTKTTRRAGEARVAATRAGDSSSKYVGQEKELTLEL